MSSAWRDAKCWIWPASCAGQSSELPAADGTSVMDEILGRLNLKTQQLGVGEGLGRNNFV